MRSKRVSNESRNRKGEKKEMKLIFYPSNLFNVFKDAQVPLHPLVFHWHRSIEYCNHSHCRS